MKQPEKKQNGSLESIGTLLKDHLSIAAWTEQRGRNRQKYFFHGMQKGEIRKKMVDPKKARTIQTAIKQSANRQGIFIATQNHGTYLLIKRIK